MNHRITIRLLFAIGGAAAMLSSLSPAAGASSDERQAPTHCAVEVIGQTDEGEYLLSEEKCFADFTDAMRSLGLGEDISSRTEALDAAASIQSTLAIHYDGAGFTGSSFSVSGVDCLGGYINAPAGWDNRVSSTLGGICGRIRHWTGTNKTGSFQDTVSSGNLLSPVNNNVSSIQYLN